MGRYPPLIIAGASYAGLQLAASAREQGYDGRIVMVGEEAHHPYQRPPLSKGLLTGKVMPEQLSMRSAEYYRDKGIELLLNQRVVAISPNERRVQLADGGTLDYGWLALTTGARCRTLDLSGAGLDGVFTLRSLDDALHIANRTQEAASACIVGGGFIGLEIASALQARGVQTTVVEAQPRLLARSFPPMMSEYLLQAHRARGVCIQLGRSLRALHGDAGRVTQAELADGTLIPCDMVVAGIGVVPNAELAAAAGLACDNGILTDACGRTRAEHILAAGDAARMLLPAWGPATVPGRYRLESIQAANDGARACASVVTGQPRPCTAVPWFWSDQFDLKFQMAGLPHPDDQVALRGDPESDRFCVFYLRHGRVAAVHTVNRPAEHMLGRRLVAAGAALSPEQAADAGFDLKSALDPDLGVRPDRKVWQTQS